jgi:hypothetical protein
VPVPDATVDSYVRNIEKLRARIEVLEDAIKYGIGMIQGGFPMEAALEMDRRLDDPDFDFQNPTTKT